MSKDVYRLGKPVELMPLETFKVTIKRPKYDPIFHDMIKKTLYENLQLYLDGFYNRKRPCNCEPTLLLRSGCQCGGS